MRDLQLLSETGEALRLKLKAASDAGRDVMVRRALKTEVRSTAGGTRVLDFVASTGAVDRYGDSIAQDGWQLDEYRKNPVLLWQHDPSILPIGKSTHVRIEDGRLMASAEFDSDTFSESIFLKLKTGFLSAVSVGFRPIKFALVDDPARRFGIDFTESELLEISVVAIPANSEALIQARTVATNKRELETQLRTILGYTKSAAAKIAAGGFAALAKPDPTTKIVETIKSASASFRETFVRGIPLREMRLKGLIERRADIIAAAEDAKRMNTAAERAQIRHLDELIEAAQRRQAESFAGAVDIYPAD